MLTSLCRIPHLDIQGACSYLAASFDIYTSLQQSSSLLHKLLLAIFTTESVRYSTYPRPLINIKVSTAYTFIQPHSLPLSSITVLEMHSHSTRNMYPCHSRVDGAVSANPIPGTLTVRHPDSLILVTHSGWRSLRFERQHMLNVGIFIGYQSAPNHCRCRSR